MKDTTKLMIEMFYIEELGYDFMGYTKDGNGDYSFHHLLVPRRENGNCTIQNGAVLFRKPHDYLHIIEDYDLDIFYAITSEMVDMNVKRYLDTKNLLKIDDLLKCFEREYCGKRTSHNNLIIKEEYTRRLIKNRNYK